MLLSFSPYKPPTDFTTLLHQAGWTSGFYTASPHIREGERHALGSTDSSGYGSDRHGRGLDGGSSHSRP